MKKSGIPYYIRETNRYDDERIAKLIARMNASAAAVYDYLLEKAFKEEGCCLEITADVVFSVAQALRLRESFVEEVISQCCNVGLFDKDVHANGGMIASATMVEKYLHTCRKMKRSPIIPEILQKFAKNSENSRNSEKIREKQVKIRENSEKFAKNENNSGILVGGINKEEMSRTLKEEKNIKEKIKIGNSDKKENPIKFLGDGEPLLFPESQPQPNPEKKAVGTTAKAETAAEMKARLEKNRKAREEAFYNTLVPFVEVYGKEMIRSFFNYWSEPNKSGTKMRFEMQPTWDVKRRLTTWSNRNSQSYGRSSTSTSQPNVSSDNESGKRYGGISELIGQAIV